MSTHNADEYLPVEVAGKISGIPPRTLRYWIKGGKLPAIAGKRGKLVRMDDVFALAELTGKSAMPTRQTSGNINNQENLATSADFIAGNHVGNVADDAAVSTAAVNQLEAIRDEWLQPLIDQIRELERERGRIEEQRDSAMAGKVVVETRVVELQRQNDDLSAEVEILRSITQALKDEPAIEPELLTIAPDASPDAASASEGDAMSADTLHQRSRISDLVLRMFGRS